MITADKGESLNVSATRIWTAKECLKKAEMMVDAPLILMSRKDNSQMVCLRVGKTVICTFLGRVKGFEMPLFFAILVDEEKEIDRGSCLIVEENPIFT